MINQDEIMKARGEIETRLSNAGKLAQECAEDLQTEISVFHEECRDAVKNGTILPSTEHEQLLESISTAQDKLKRALDELLTAEDNCKYYFRFV